MRTKQKEKLLVLMALVMLTGCVSKSPSSSKSEDTKETLAAIIASAGYVETSTPGAILGTYEWHSPILIENVHATVDNPYVVEGYEISSDTSNGIEVRNCENIVIRDNYLHDCIWSADPEDYFSSNEGFAILVGESENILVESNVLEHNKLGFAAYHCRNVRLLYNTIKTTIVSSSVRFEQVAYSEIAHNYLSDNGTPEWFWAPGYRNIGIFVVRSDHIDVHDNTVIRSTSDGISVGGQIDGGGLTTHKSDWTGTASHISIYNNLVLDNMEIGM